VIARSDPGVPNWIDTVDNTTGIALWRWYLAESHPVPTVRKVPLTELRNHLPRETPRVSAQARQARIATRAAAVRRRYGF
jgi:hypothetical protein